MATSPGPIPTANVAITVLVALSITDTEFAPKLVAYVRDPSGVKANPPVPTPSIVTITVLVAVSITEAELVFDT